MDLHQKAIELVEQMSTAEKASLCSGKNFWFLKGIKRLNLPEIMVTDGPHGLRKQENSADHLGINQSVPAVCFPTASATACSFDRGLLKEIGQTIGEECRQENVSVLLGPGINIKRSPLCGRNFEYFSEDPLLSGELAAAFINGVQSQDVGVSVKHYAANNQETRRVSADSVMDERTFREIYLPAFEIAVKKAHPWTIMCSYNRLFGEFASQNKRLLTSILRDEWGFDGVVLSDWGATAERVPGLEAGLDLEMPGGDRTHDFEIIQAVEDGLLSPETLDTAAVRITELILRAGQRQPFTYDKEAHHQLARRAAAESAVLLKNEENILPGNPDQKAAVIGVFAKQPRYQGTGSSKIVPIKLDNACEELAKLGLEFTYADGYKIESDETDQFLIDQACETAKDKEIVYVFAGLPDRYEAESFDRDNMQLPESHNQLITALSKVNSKIVVVLHGGSAMELPWADEVSGILLVHLGGEASGGACADLLLGKENPAGKLAETWPFHTADAPSHAYFPGYPLTVEYRENIFVGYRYYDTAQKAVRYPFGYGLSYTQFETSDLTVSADNITDQDSLSISCTVKNSGTCAGSEVIQLYISARDSVIIRAAQELKGFEKVHLQPGENKQVHFTLSKRDFAFYHSDLADWVVESGTYEIRLGSSSRDIRLSSEVVVTSTQDVSLPDFRQKAACYYNLKNGLQVSDAEFTAVLGRPIPARERVKGTPHTINSTITDIQDKWFGRLLLKIIRKQSAAMAKDDPDMLLMVDKMMMDLPLRFLAMMSGGDEGGMTVNQVYGMVEILNGHWIKGLRLMLKKQPA